MAMRDAQLTGSLIQKRLAQGREHVPRPKRLLVINFGQPGRERPDTSKADLTGRPVTPVPDCITTPNSAWRGAFSSGSRG